MEIEDRGCCFFSIITTMNVSDIICHEYSGRTNVETKKMSIFIKRRPLICMIGQLMMSSCTDNPETPNI